MVGNLHIVEYLIVMALLFGILVKEEPTFKKNARVLYCVFSIAFGVGAIVKQGGLL